MSKKKTILIILGKGGHTAQMLRLVRLLGNKFEYEYVIRKDDILSSKMIEIPGKIWKITTPRSYDMPLWKAIINTIKSFFEAFRIVKNSKATVVISCGAGLAVPISYISKLFGKKVVFIESWSRVWKPSMSGKLIYPIADMFFIQWKELTKYYPKAIYAGRLG